MFMIMNSRLWVIVSVFKLVSLVSMALILFFTVFYGFYLFSEEMNHQPSLLHFPSNIKWNYSFVFPFSCAFLSSFLKYIKTKLEKVTNNLEAKSYFPYMTVQATELWNPSPRRSFRWNQVDGFPFEVILRVFIFWFVFPSPWFRNVKSIF